MAWLEAGRHTLKITIQEQDQKIEIKLEGRVVGPWVPELRRVWVETAPQLGTKTLSIDIQHVTYADAGGKQALREIYAQTRARLIANSPWAEYLAEEIMKIHERA
jgi:anti-anti-sigma regulatory factor